MKRLVSKLVAVALAVTMLASFQVSAAVKPVDSWADAAVNKFNKAGFLDNISGDYQSNENITRGAYAQLLTDALNLQEKSTKVFTDVAADSVYADAIAKVEKAGIMTGMTATEFGVDSPLQRQQAAQIFANAFGITAAKGDDALKPFEDADKVLPYAKAALNALVSLGYYKGTDAGGKVLLDPTGNLTYAQAIVLTDRIATFVGSTTAGIDKSTVKGNLVISKAGTVLTDTKITGNLYITAGVGEGDVTLNNVTVDGTLFVAGGGANSIHFGNSKVNNMVIDKPNVSIKGSAQFNKVVANESFSMGNDAGSQMTVKTFSVPAQAAVAGQTAVVPTIDLGKGLAVTKLELATNVTMTGEAKVKEASILADKIKLVLSVVIEKVSAAVSVSSVELTNPVTKATTTVTAKVDAAGNVAATAVTKNAAGTVVSSTTVTTNTTAGTTSDATESVTKDTYKK